MATIDVDGKTCEFDDNQNLLHGCLSAGIDVPYFCWHPVLGSVGSCRLCAVKQYADANDTRGRLVMSCMTPAKGVSRISVNDSEAASFRKNVIEWLMTSHPHDCPVCDAGGACHLQDMTVLNGHNYRRHRFPKRTHENQDLGPLVHHEMNRCIQCYRCVRYYRDYAGGNDLGVFASKANVYFGRAESGTLESEFAGNLVEVCPTGVFTDKTMRSHYTRKWDLQTAPSICPHCSVGCNITPGERYGTVRGVGNRFHPDINGYFLCDRGRFGYEFTSAPDRIRVPTIREGQEHKPVDGEAVKAAAAKLLKAGRVIGIGSPRASVEANFALRHLVGADRFYSGIGGTAWRTAHKMVGFLKAIPHISTVQEIENADVALVLGENPSDTAPRLALALRQLAWRTPRDAAANTMGIPDWHDAALRTAVTGEKGSLFILYPHGTRLDDAARMAIRMAPDHLARLGRAIAHVIDPDMPPIHDLTDEEAALSSVIGQQLLVAKRPQIITGTGLGSEELISAAFQVVQALERRGRPVGGFGVVPEANTIGLSLFDAPPLEAAFAEIDAGTADAVIVLENDLYERLPQASVDRLFERAHVMCLDHLSTRTVAWSRAVLPTAPWTEDTGTFVNAEGRAQRYFEVMLPAAPVAGAWSVLAQVGAAADRPMPAHFDALVDLLITELPVFQGIESAAPDATFRIEGLKLARATPRFSGRTAIHAGIQVSEAKPPQDPDSPYAFSMEGYSGRFEGTLVPFFWAPHWNSNQAVNKFQSRVGGPLRGHPVGSRLITRSFTHMSELPPTEKWPGLRALPRWRVFGSEPQSNKAQGLAKLVKTAEVAVHPDDAAAQGWSVGDRLLLNGVSRMVAYDSTLPKGWTAVDLDREGADALGLYGELTWLRVAPSKEVGI